jgi:hypothetical protein
MRLRYFLVVAAVVLVISVFARCVVSWQNYGDLDHAAPGAWLGMAMDARDGVVYRPVVSDMGYGGTRYAPIFPIVVAGFMTAGFSPIVSGFLAGIGATVVALSGMYVLLRRLGSDVIVAGAMTTFFLAATVVHCMILGIRCDLLPLGLSLWGMAAVVVGNEAVGAGRRRWFFVAPGICFAVAIGCKLTSVFGIGAAVIWLLAQKKMRSAMELCAATAVCLVVVAGAIEWASHGRAGEILYLSASGGGSIRRLARGPAALIQMIYGDNRVLGVFWPLAFVLVVATWSWKSLPAIFLLISTLGTMLIFGSPGTHSSHLVDMTAGAILVLAAPVARRQRLQRDWMVVVGAIVVVSAVMCWMQIRFIMRQGEKERMNEALADVERSTSHGPILSELPLLPILQGERPYMLDAFAFRTIRAKEPSLTEQLWKELDGHYFRAVILSDSPDDPSYSSDEEHFGPGFVERMEKDYELVSKRGGVYVFVPRG